MFWNRRPKQPVKTFDRTKKRPVIRASICTGEQVACFQDVATGRLEEILLLRDDKDKAAFLAEYGIREEELKIVY